MSSSQLVQPFDPALYGKIASFLSEEDLGEWYVVNKEYTRSLLRSYPFKITRRFGRLLNYSRARQTLYNEHLNQRKLLRLFIWRGWSDLATQILPRVSIRPRDVSYLIMAIRNEDEFLIRLLLSQTPIDPSARDNRAINEASQMGNPSVVRLLLSHPQVDPGSRNSLSLVRGVQSGSLEVVNLLLEDERVDPSCWNNLPLELSVVGATSIFRALIKSNRVFPSYVDGRGRRRTLIRAVQHQKTTIVTLLLRKYSHLLSDTLGEALREATSRGDLRIVRILSDYPLSPPRYRFYQSIRLASNQGHLSILRVLLNKHKSFSPRRVDRDALIDSLLFSVRLDLLSPIRVFFECIEIYPEEKTRLIQKAIECDSRKAIRYLRSRSSPKRKRSGRDYLPLDLLLDSSEE